MTNLLSTKQNKLYAGDNIKLRKNTDGTYTISAISAKDLDRINSYNALDNKPSINGILLTGNKGLDTLGIQPKGSYQNKLTAGNLIEITDEDIINVILPEDLITEEELETRILRKADASKTLSGYNIEDAYTKDEVDEAILNNNKMLFNDSILDAPNGIANYTETSITIKEGLNVIFSNGLEFVLDNDIVLDLSNEHYTQDIKDFYLLIQEVQGTLSCSIIGKSSIKTLFTDNIPVNETGIIKNLYDNCYYVMEDVDHGIHIPRKINIKILGEGTILDSNGFIKIQSFAPYGVFNAVTLDELLLKEKDLQPALTFGENFKVKGNKVDFLIPFNYVTKEYLIENDYTTQTNVDDAVRIHNTNGLAHTDIRNKIDYITDRLNSLYNSVSALSSDLASLTTRVTELERKIRKQV